MIPNEKIFHSPYPCEILFIPNWDKDRSRTTTRKKERTDERNPVHDRKSRKEVHMDGPIISFDVPKGCSHAQGFLSPGKPLGKAFRFEHNMEGYGKISELASRLKEKTGVNPSVVYEFTGVYAMPLLAFLIDSGFTIYQISPLESAKMRKAEIRPTKNDSLDCSTIAKFYYGRSLRPLSIPVRRIQTRRK